MKHNGTRYSAVSLFSGGMGLDIGLYDTGRFSLLACVEMVPSFCDTIRVNRDAGRIDPNMRMYQNDIRRLDARKIMKDLGLKRGEVDLVVGGPPCQSFSTAGRRGTVQDPRGTLLWDFLRFVEAMQPKMFLMENVRGLMSAALKHRPISERPEKGGAPLERDEEPGSVIRLFLRDLHDQYRLDCFEVNAVNYGAPQLRERVLFIGNRFNRVVEFPRPTHSQPVSEHKEWFVSGAQGMKPFRTLGDALKGLNDSDRVLMDFSPRKKRYLELVPPGGNWRSLPGDIAKESMGEAYCAKGGRSGWWRRLSLELPCPTVVTMPNHASTALCHPSEVRALSLRECARVQEFPDEWEFRGTAAEQYAQVGNAVPIRLGSICGEVLGGELRKIYESRMDILPGNNPSCRVVYLRSHVRTRHWFKDGAPVVWEDGEENNISRYGRARTNVAVSTIGKEKSYGSKECKR